MLLCAVQSAEGANDDNGGGGTGSTPTTVASVLRPKKGQPDPASGSHHFHQDIAHFPGVLFLILSFLVNLLLSKTLP